MLHQCQHNQLLRDGENGANAALASVAHAPVYPAGIVFNVFPSELDVCEAIDSIRFTNLLPRWDLQNIQ